MYLTSGIKSECCGCGVCSQVCPRRCITIIPDEDGFLFPVINDSSCIRCHLCEKVCPVENIPVKFGAQSGQVLVAARCKDEDAVMEAASGGAFGAIVRTLRNHDEWMVWGAAFDDNLCLTHRCSRDEIDLVPLHKSKYVQSQLKDTFPQIKQQLKERTNVIFSGTPCQVAALHNYLQGKNTDHLVCIDLVCHGVPNQKFFDTYCEEEGKRFRSEVIAVQFRLKTRKKIRNQWNSRNILLVTKDGKKHIENRYTSRFLRAYHSFIFYRESCHFCVFANPTRQGDLTIADFWGIQRFYPELSADSGVSLIQANTEKGKEILEQIEEQMNIYMIDRDQYLRMTNGAMVAKSPKNLKRESFLEYARTHSFNESVDRYVPKYKEMIKIEVARRISPETRRIIKQLMKMRS